MWSRILLIVLAVIVGIIVLLILLLFLNRKKLPMLINQLDNFLTLTLTNYQRERLVNFLNSILRIPPVQWLTARILSFILKNEFVAINYTLHLDSSAYIARENKKLEKNINRVTWSNWVGIHCFDPLAIYMPGSGPYENVFEQYSVLKEYDFAGLKEVQRMVREAENDHVRVRCVASGHALSDVVVNSDILLISKKMTMPQRRANQSYIKEKYRNGYKAETLHDGSVRVENRYLWETGSGTLIIDLKRILEKEGFAFQNLGGADVQGFFGAVSTSTHGTGMHLPPFPDMIKSIMLVAAGGKAYRVEPADGITDRVAYEQSPEFLEHGIELRQDDDEFYSAVVAMGCFGVVFSLVMEVMDFYYLDEYKTPGTWEEVKQQLVDPSKNFLKKYRHIDITVNPYPTNEKGEFDPSNGRHFCLLNTKNYTYLERETSPQRRDYNASSRRNFLASFGSGIFFAGSIATWLFNKNPIGIPKSIYNSLSRIVDYKKQGLGYTDSYYNVLNQGLKQMKFFGYALELSFPLKDNEYIRCIDRIMELLGEMMAYKQFLPAPLAIRFCHSSKAYLSMMHDRPSCMVELFSLKDFVGGKEALQRIEREMYPYKARPHWTKL